MRLFGEEFLEITRINHARNGRYVLLTGVRKGPLKSRFCADLKVAERDQHAGIFLYSIKVNQVVLE